jgi:hypothetical protein
MAWLKNIIITFCYVLAGSTICATIFITQFWPKETQMITILIQLIGLSILGSAGNLIFYSKRELSKKKMKVRTIIHYIYVYLSVLSCAYLFGWIVPGNLKQTLVMLIMICCVNLSVSYALKKKEDKTAEIINRKLSKMNLIEKENQDD